MTISNASDIGRAIGVVTTFMKKVETAIRQAGGTDEHVARLAKDDSDAAVGQFAQALVSGVGAVAQTFRDQIQAGGYDALYGFAQNPEGIKGPAKATVLDHPGVRLTTRQVYERYGSRMASLSELLDYGAKNPEAQRQHPIAIVWQDEEGQFWYAFLDGGGSVRRLFVRRDRPDDEWSDSCRFLVRK